jgi:hypothetical protein
MSEPFAAFGPGIVIVQNLSIAVPAPINIGYAQELTIDLAATPKELFGQNQFPIAVARGTVKATGKIKAAVMSGYSWNAAFFGQTMASGGFAWSIANGLGEKHTLVGTTQQVTNHTTYEKDLGVTYSSTGLPLQQVAAGSETTGFYSISYTTGTYTVSSGDSGAALTFTYTYTVGTGQNLTIANQLLGTTPIFQLDYYTNYNQPSAKPFAVRLFNCVGTKIALATKLEDFVMPEIDFGFFANGAGNVIEYVFPELS